MTLPRLSSLLLLLLLLTICTAPAAATSPYADLLQDPTRSTEDKLRRTRLAGRTRHLPDGDGQL